MAAGVRMSVTVPGLRQLGLVYRDAAAVRIPAAVSAALEPVAQAALEDAKSKAPRRTGVLASSMAVRKSGPVAWAIKGGPAVNPTSKSNGSYFNAVHWGTGPRAGKPGPHLITKKPFLFDAWQEHKAAAVEAANRALSGIVEELQ